MAKTKKSKAQAAPDTTYNGWKNYETWAVALWIDNEESTYNRARFMAREAAEEAKADEEEIATTGKRAIGVIEVEWPRKADAILAGRLKEWMEEEMPDLGASMWADLLNAAFGEVDWYEIAHAMQGE